MKEKRHNPEKVPSCRIPKGCRLLNPSEIGDSKEYNCAMWLPREKRFSRNFNQKPNYRIWTYIVRI
jgi:hypothetical protein